MMKVCSNPKCKSEGAPQPITEFHKDRSKRDGLSTRCKECKLEYQKQYALDHTEEKKQYDLDNKEKLTEYDKRWSQTLNGRHHAYKRNAKRKNRTFELTLEQFENITSQTCCHCGDTQKAKNFVVSTGLTMMSGMCWPTVVPVALRVTT